jgi:SAM-dependent methyltransferase
MAAAIDSLTSATLKHLRERWWDDSFTGFLVETLRPRPGNRILDVGCGEGLAEVSIGRQHISQIRLVGVDLVFSKIVEARATTAAHNMRAAYAVADGCRLPFTAGAFDSIYCVAVLQHVGDVDAAVSEFARVTRRGGRVVAVEPDNSARYAFSPTDAGQRAFEMSRRFFAADAAARNDAAELAVGPKLPALFARHGIEPIDVRLFPVSQVQLGAPPAAVWAERRAAIERAVGQAPSHVQSLGRDYLNLLGAYAAEAAQAGPSFVEIQNTMLFATVGQRLG